MVQRCGRHCEVSGFRSVCIIAEIGKVVGAFLRDEDVDDAADGVPQAVDGALGGLSQMRLELGEGLFDQIEVRAGEPGERFGQPSVRVDIAHWHMDRWDNATLRRVLFALRDRGLIAAAPPVELTPRQRIVDAFSSYLTVA